jgi:hypothetical protein
MRRVPVAAIILVVVSGIYFQVGGSSNFANMVTSNPPGNIGLQKTSRQLTKVEPATDRSINFPVLVSQATRPGPPSKPHKVSLFWNPSAPISETEQDVISGYNVYRRTTVTATYVRINSSLVPDTSYVDDAVQAGETYVYETRSVNNLGIESAPSNQVRVTIPYP